MQVDGTVRSGRRAAGEVLFAGQCVLTGRACCRVVEVIGRYSFCYSRFRVLQRAARCRAHPPVPGAVGRFQRSSRARQRNPVAHTVPTTSPTFEPNPSSEQATTIIAPSNAGRA